MLTNASLLLAIRRLIAFICEKGYALVLFYKGSRSSTFVVFLSLYIFVGPTPFFAQHPYTIATVAFYNVENLFDCEDDPLTLDNEYTVNGKAHWTKENYNRKVENVSRVMSEIGATHSNNAPVLIGLAEIENKRVLEDLTSSSSLSGYDYKSIHFDAPDRRGIDVALLYQNDIFVPNSWSKHELVIYDQEQPGKRVYTRDQLLVSGWLDGDLIHCIINHWPSRRGGQKKSAYKRWAAAKLNKKIMDSLQALDPYAKIIAMGDFNDNPNNASIKKVLNTRGEISQLTRKTLFNPMEKMMKKGFGTLAYRDQWHLFDQILVSKGIADRNGEGYRYYKAGIFSEEYLLTPSGPYQGYPFRSFANGVFTAGYSDHFPVYIFLIKKQKAKK